MARITDFRGVIELWPGISTLAEDLDEKAFTVEKWRTRNRIPDRVWKRLVARAESRRLPVTTDLLADLAARASAP